VLAWLADETWVLDAFKAGKDIYCETASQMFGVPVEKHGQNSELRQKGKVAVLSCGYGGGVGALLNMGADKMGLSENEMQHIITRWRKSSPHIVQFWYTLEKAARRAIQRKLSTTLPHGIKFMSSHGHLLVQLPSKRYLVYLNARMGTNKFGDPSIVYDGVDMTKKAAGAALAELETYSGKLAENITQAVARDCLAIAMKNVEAANYPIVAHIHDEVVLEVPDTDEYNLDEAIRLMTQNVDWNEGLPLNAAGFESYFYMKD
jgi:DNA polymerase